MSSSNAPKVFLSYSVKDSGLASFVTAALESEGVGVFTIVNLTPGTTIEKKIREDLIASTAVIILVTPNSVASQNVAFEAGMAMAIWKPIYVLYDGVSPSQLPTFISAVKMVPVSMAGEVARQILANDETITDAETAVIVDAYQEIGVSVDQLVMNPELLMSFAASISSRVNKTITGEGVARLLMTRRKQGKLPRIKAAAHPA